jgi:hypothetical protein
MGEDHSDEKFLKKEFDKIDTNKGGFILFDEVRNFQFLHFIFNSIFL